MFSKLRNAFVGLLVIAASTVAVTVSDSPVSATGTVAPSAVTSSPSIGAQSVPVWSNTNVIAVSAGLDHTCAIQASDPTASSGSLFCWGKASSIGNGSTENSNIPVLVSSSNGFTNTAVTAVGAGGDTTCAIEGGTLWCWGGAGLGNLGNGTAGTSNVPVKVSASGTGAEEFFNNGNVTAVTAEYARTCAIESGKVFCWGSANDALGLGSANAVANVPNRVADSAPAGFRAASATSIHMGTNFACSVAGGQIYCWGYGFSGQLGNGTNGDSNRPVLVSNSSGSEFTNAAVTSAFLGQDHACAVKAGRVSCWGKGTSNQLGDGVGTNRNIPAAVAQGGGFTNASAVTSGAAGDKHSCAIEAGILYCWGLNGNEGRLGDGGGADSSVPVKVSASLVAGFTNTGVGTGAVTAVTANSSGGNTGHACAIENKVVYCWGSFGMYGKLGIGATTGQGVSRPVKVFVVSAPGAASINSVYASSGSLNVSITQPSDGGSIITGYDYTTDNGVNFTNVARPSGSNGTFFSVTISNLTNGTPYSIKVRAVNAIGAGSWSAPSSGTPTAGGGNNGGNNGGGNCTGGASIMPSSTSGVGTVGTPMSLSGPVPSGFMGTPTFTISSVPLPAGLTLNAQTGLVAGTPTASSFASVIINVVNGAKSCQYNITFSITPSGGGGMPNCTTGAPGVRGTNPTLDTTFGTAGAIAFTVDGGTTALRSGVATADGNFVVAESRYSSSSVTNLRKYTPAGVLVPGFGTDGVLTIDKATGSTSENVYAMRELSDGSLAVLYSVVPVSGPKPIYIAKVTSAGAIDTSWATAGFAEVANATGINARELKLLSDGSMLVLTSTSSGMVLTNGLVKVLPTGTVDATFGTAGTLILPEYEFSFDVSGSDAIFVGGGSSATPNDATIRKFSSAGVLDTSWGSGGTLTLPRIGAQGDDNFVSDVAVMANGKMYVAVNASSMQSPSSTSVLLRLLADGTIDSSFGDGTTLPSTVMNVDDIVVLRDGNILVTAISGMMMPEMGVGLVSASGELDSAFADELAVMQFGDCPLSDMMVVQTTTGEVFGVGSKYGTGTQGSLWKLNFTGTTAGGGSNADTPSTPATPAADTPSTPATPAADTPSTPATTAAVPTLVTSSNAAALVRAPGAQAIIVNGEEVVIESKTVSIVASRTPESQRTPAQVASIQQAGAALLQQFLASLPAGATTNVSVVNTATGAVMQNLVFDANGNSVDVAVEDIVFLDGPQLSLMIGSNNANITADGKYQVGAGGIIGVTGAGLGAGVSGEVVAMSTPTLLANFQTTAAGDFNKSATLPESIGVGDHTLVVAAGSTYALMGIRVLPAALPTTGSSSDRVVIIALFTLVFGALFFRGRRISLI